MKNVLLLLMIFILGMNSCRKETPELTVVNEIDCQHDDNYNVYSGLITQTGTSDPMLTVFSPNEIGNIIWTRNASGSYNGTLSGAFPATKTWIYIGSIASNNIYEIEFIRMNDGVLYLGTLSNGTGTDNILFETPIEIRVYY